MNRRQFLVISSAAIAAVRSSAASAAQSPTPTRSPTYPTGPVGPPQPPPAQPRFEAIRRNAGYFTARGGTIGWLFNKEAVVAIDTQFPDTAQLFVDGLRERAGGRGIDVAFNTHHHGDHTGGNAIVKAAAKRLVAHVRVPELQKQVASQAAAKASGPALTPVVAGATFDKVWSEEMGDERVTAKHYGPGHTGGDAIIHFERAQVVHMGDLFFRELHPRVDRPAGASIRNWITTLETISKEMPGDTIYIAGHARPGLPVTAQRADVLTLRDYFDAVLAHVRQAIAKGRPKDDVAKLGALPGFENYQSSGTVLTLSGVLGVAYDELTM
jgi:glyoxylase-like metal-dependent hydrolase (beta-lactamase superfamily II)